MKILPCPFCGEKGKIINTSHMDDSIYSVICFDGDFNCWACRAPDSSWWRTKDQAVKAWNTRFPQPAFPSIESMAKVILEHFGGEVIENGIEYAIAERIHKHVRSAKNENDIQV